MSGWVDGILYCTDKWVIIILLFIHPSKSSILKNFFSQQKMLFKTKYSEKKKFKISFMRNIYWFLNCRWKILNLFFYFLSSFFSTYSSSFHWFFFFFKDKFSKVLFSIHTGLSYSCGVLRECYCFKLKKYQPPAHLPTTPSPFLSDKFNI